MVNEHKSGAQRMGVAPAVLLLAALLFLPGCAASSNGATDSDLSDLKLVETKSPVQLLRNNALGRVDAQFVSEVRETTDGSAACFTDDGNPGDLVRQWRSSGEAVLVDGADREQVTEGLIQSFVDDGWNDVEISSSSALTLLDSDSSVASIEIASTDVAAIGVIRITVTGPCVKTAGPDSDEVRALEGDQ